MYKSSSPRKWSMDHFWDDSIIIPLHLDPWLESNMEVAWGSIRWWPGPIVAWFWGSFNKKSLKTSPAIFCEYLDAASLALLQVQLLNIVEIWSSGWCGLVRGREGPRCRISAGRLFWVRQFFFVFSTLPGEIIHFDYYFSNGLKQPTSNGLYLIEHYDPTK